MTTGEAPHERLRGLRIPLFKRWLGGYGKRRSFITLMYLAMRADGFESPEEREEIFALMDRTRTLRRLPRPKAQAMLERAAETATRMQTVKLLEKASRRFREQGELAKSIFMHVADIVLADRALVESEEKFVEQLAYFLQIEATDAAGLFATLQIKDTH